MTANQTNTQFKSVDSIGKRFLMNELETNLKMFLDWSFLQIGGFYNVSIPTSGQYGGDFSTLRPVQDKQFTDGQVWEGARKEWVWESDLDYSIQPNAVTGVVVNGVASASGYYVNHPLGRIVFTTPISTSSTVKTSYAYRGIQVYKSDDAAWFRQLQYSSYRPDDTTQFQQIGKGEWNIGGQQRVQLPAIIIECVPRAFSTPFELGNGLLQVRNQDVIFHIVAENGFDRNQLTDILGLQQDLNMILYDTDDVIASGDYPLNYQGSLTAADWTYPDLVTLHPWEKARWRSVVTSEVESPSPLLYEASVRVTFESILGELK